MASNLSRRTLLRGMFGGTAVALGLPVLEAMLDAHGEALANGEALPRRFGVFFWGNGVPPSAWVPPTQGDGWTPSTCLQPIADAGMAPLVSVVSGTAASGASPDHTTSLAMVLSGHTVLPGLGGTPSPSCDQIAADHLGQSTLFRSLEVAVSRAPNLAGFIGDDASAAWRDANLLPAETSPRALFERLFGLGFEPDTSEIDAKVSLIDVVLTDATRLSNRLGAADRARLEAHLDGLRAIENRLLTEPPACSVPGQPSDFASEPGHEPLAEVSDAFAQLLAVAFACDLTRVFNFRFTHAIADTVFWPVGANEGIHTITHLAGMTDLYAQTVRYTMERFAVLLSRLAELPEGDGTLLDQCAIVCTTDLADGAVHSIDDYPILLAGRAGGALHAGTHLRSEGDHVARVPFTALKAVGVPIDSFGVGPGQVTQTLPALEA